MRTRAVRGGRTVVQRMHDDIIALVTSEGLRPGDRIPTEAELEARFGGSRPTIREALKLLEQDGVVDVEHGRGRFLTAIGTLRAHRPITRFESITRMGEAFGIPTRTRCCPSPSRRRSRAWRRPSISIRARR